MQIETVTIHNFASIHHETITLGDYNLLIGENNSGKSNTINAIRAFYGDLDYDLQIHNPNTNEENEAWIEICFQLSQSEFSYLGRQYWGDDNTFVLRRCLTECSFDGQQYKAGIYAKIGQELETEEFCTFTDIKNHQLGQIIYIPAISKIEDQTRTSGPSPLRDTINKIVDALVDNSEAFLNLTNSFREFEQAIMTETTSDDLSLYGIEDELNDGISRWGVKFKLRVNPIDKDTIIRSLINHYIVDETNNSEQRLEQYGAGMQREIIFHLIRISAKYQNNKAKLNGDGFKANFILYLFEEPEAFLHPAQQLEMAKNLRNVGSNEAHQVIVSSHSSHFVSQESEALTSLICLHKHQGCTRFGQISDDELQDIISNNQEIYQILDQNEIHPDEVTSEMELIKYFMWLDPDRCSMFFAKKVLLVEGMTERVFINYLIRNGIIHVAKSVYILDCQSKFNIHRYMQILGRLKVKHSVLFDRDKDKNIQLDINNLIRKYKNPYTDDIHGFQDDFEEYIGVQTRKEQGYNNTGKPQHMLFQYKTGNIRKQELNNFVRLIERLIN
jgi:putative ATP-dependent endonuclease of OLD family